MLISLKEYAEKLGKSKSLAKKYVAQGRFKTAVKVGKLWLIDENEPLPESLWSQKEPAPKMVSRIIYLVYYDTEDAFSGVSEHGLVLSTFDFDEAKALYEEKSREALHANVGSSPKVVYRAYMNGYRIVCKENLTADEALIKCKITDKSLVYMIDDDGEWWRNKTDLRGKNVVVNGENGT